MSAGEGSDGDAGDRIRPTFEVRDRTVLTVFDPIERRRINLDLGAPSAPRPVAPEQFRVPVDAAVAVEAESVTFPNVVTVVVRDDDGAVRTQAGVFADEQLPPGRYDVEVDAAVKLYLQVEGGVSVTADAEHTRVSFDGERDVLVGARSRHGRPAATITVEETPRDAMAAVTAFGSALKTTSPERSYPTLRGHLPLVELGDELDVPAVLETPDTGIELRLPASYRYVYPAAPLAYYLGAEVVPGDRPVLTTDTGLAYDLDREPGYERTVERVLKQVFLLDCAVRTEGLYPVDLHERAALEGAIEFDPDALYDRPPAERLAAYLDHPFDAVEEFVPEWRLVTHVEAGPSGVEVLPFVVNDLAVVRTPGEQTDVPVSQQEAAIDEFLRGGTRSATGPSRRRPAEEDTTVEQVWVGRGQTLSANEATLTAFYNRLERDPGTGPIDITVVCNDPSMSAERDVVDEVYGSRERFPFDVTVRRGLSAAALRETLAEPADFLHYIGHIDGRGFECADGRLDAATLDAVGVDAFLLNACQSYRQGMALVQRGSIGGVVTHSDVVNRGAVAVGSTLARLLNRGFPLRAALSLARNASVVGSQYVVVGDGGLSISQPESVPNCCVVERSDEGFTLTMDTYPTTERGMGSLVKPLIERENSFYLVSSRHVGYTLSREELSAFLSLENVPVRADGDLYWSGELGVDDL